MAYSIRKLADRLEGGADMAGHFGPSDMLGPSGIRAADLVAQWGSDPTRSDAERTAARLFLGQWPEGPSL